MADTALNIPNVNADGRMGKESQESSIPMEPEGKESPESSILKEGEPRQVGHSDGSVASGLCPGSLGSEHRKNKSLALMKARLNEQQLEKELELLKARNQVRLAELELDSECQSEEGIELDSKIKVKNYLARLNDYLPETVDLNSRPCTARLKLPKVELEMFDGNPRNYWRFAQQFKYYVEDRLMDQGQRLLYLLHYCTGSAKEAIAECVMLPPRVAYNRAREILKDLYGREHIVARAMLDDLFRRLKPLHENAQSLSRLSVSMQSCHIALTQMNYMSDLDSISTLERILRTLSVDARRRWARTADDIANSNRNATFYDLCQFVSSEARVVSSRFGMLASVGDQQRPVYHTVRENEERLVSSGRTYNVQLQPKEHCPLCDIDHQLPKCQAFINMSVLSRWNVARRKRACFTCLRRVHVSERCNRAKECGEGGCKGVHHPLLHRDEYLNTVKDKCVPSGICNSTLQTPSGTCLGVVPVRLRGPKGFALTYALLDSGSDVTLIEKSLVDEVGLSGKAADLNVSTVSGSVTMKSTTLALEIDSLSCSETIAVERAYCIASLPVNPPVMSLSSVASRYDHLRDTTFVEIPDKRVRLLIGEDVPEAHWPMKSRIGKRKQPFAVETPLGWVLFGPLSFDEKLLKQAHHICMEDLDVKASINELYNNEFHDLEAAGTNHSDDDKKAICLIRDSITYLDGHYEVGLPWKRPLKLPNNYRMAFQRIQCLRKRLSKDLPLLRRYRESMEQSIRKNYLVPVPNYQLNPGYCPRWHLPHHPVVNPKKPEKLRIVLDCAAKFEGVSLNDRLYQGPDTTANLVGVLLRFRNYPVAVAADVEEMFMQVKVPESDRGALRILWWKFGDIDERLVEYQMTAHPFGATSSPFCAN